MLLSGVPLVSVHYFKNEIFSFPNDTQSLPKQLINNVNIRFFSFIQPKIGSIGTWLYELPNPNSKKWNLVTKTQSIRNTTLAVARYWSEFQAAKTLCTPLKENKLGLILKNEKLLARYKEKSLKFHSLNIWHGAPLGEIRDIVFANDSDQNSISEILTSLKEEFVILEGKNNNRKPSIFVSYSHADSKSIELILDELQILGVNIDKNITPGDLWRKYIKNSIEEATIAVLLLSDNFFSSDFINENEYPLIEDLCKRQKLKIISIVIEEGKIINEFLEKFQFLNRNMPFSKCSQIEKKAIIDKMRNILSWRRDMSTPNALKASKKIENIII